MSMNDSIPMEDFILCVDAWLSSNKKDEYCFDKLYKNYSITLKYMGLPLYQRQVIVNIF